MKNNDYQIRSDERFYDEVLHFESNSFRIITEYLNTLDMEAHFIDGDFLYKKKNSTIMVCGHEGNPGRILLLNVDEKVRKSLEEKTGERIH